MMFSSKALRTGMLVAAVVALVSSLMVAAVSAQPSIPPNRFFGSVTLDGAPAPAGTVVTATIGGVSCGEVTVATAGSYSRLDVVDNATTAGCGTAGAAVDFLVGGNLAVEGATWASGSFTALDLTAVSGAVEPTVVPPTATPVVATATPVVVVATATPVIITGSGGYLDGGSGTAWWAYTAGGLGLLLLGTAGVAAYRRLRP